MTTNLNIEPDIKISVKQTFGIESEMEVKAFSKKKKYGAHRTSYFIGKRYFFLFYILLLFVIIIARLIFNREA